MKIEALAVTKGSNDVISCIIDTKKLSLEQIEKKSIKSIKNIDGFSNYKDFMTQHSILGVKLTQKDIKSLMNGSNIKELYFYDPLPGDLVKEYNEYWFRYVNYVCVECKSKCKQSSRTVVQFCKDRKPKEK